MTPALEFLAAHWAAAVLLGVALGLAVRRALRRQGGLPLVAAGLALLAAGAVLLPATWAWWLGVGAAAVLGAMVLVLLLSGAWWPPAAWAAAAAVLLAAGGLWVKPGGAALAGVVREVPSVEFVRPAWLGLLVLLPAVVLLAGRRLDWRGLRRGRVESWRPWAAVLLRCAIVALLALALAEPRLRRPNERVTVLFVLDRSQSIPEELGPAPGGSGGVIDRRWDRVRRFINDAVQRRGAGHERDRAGLIVFGRRPRLELPPSDAPRFNLSEITSRIDGGYTDIAAALKLALASFPEGSGKRIVLISDGNENLGNAEEQARLARSLGVQIDVVPIAAGRRNEDEVLVERVDVPPRVEQGGQVPVRVLVRSYNPNVVVGRLTLRQVTEGKTVVIGEARVSLHLGLNPFPFTRALADVQRSYTYEAEFEPERVVDARGRVLFEGRPPGDRPQNNRASAHVMARGRRRVLILEANKDDDAKLAETLRAAGRSKFEVDAMPVSLLGVHADRDRLARFLGDYDCVILANVAADQVTAEQMEALRSNTHDQGCGLVMIGGPDGFGAGGWQNTPVERALPVNADINSLEVAGKGGLVLIMHACEMADGNSWEKKIAKLAIDKLGPADEVGVLQFTMQTVWHIPMTRVGPNRNRLKAQVDTMTPGDMPDFDPALVMAHKELTNPTRNLSTKHIIIISDGDPMQQNGNILGLMRRDKVTVTTVGVATHGAPQDRALEAIAKATRGRYHHVTNASQLPAIYTKETRLVSQSFTHERPFRPVVVFRSGPTDKLPDPLAPLGGFVRTTPKPSPLVEIPLITPRIADQDFPLLAYWHYGLGKSVAFTSDAGSPKFWSRAWAEQEGGVYAKFWEQVVDWSLRPTESKRLNMLTEYRDGKVKVTVEAHTDDGRPDTKLHLRAGVTGPGDPEAGKKQDLAFVQKNSGVYELEVKAEEAGSYFVTAQATRTVKRVGRDGKEHEVEEAVDTVRSGVSLPYSPEFSELESNTALLERIRELTDGRRYDDDDAALAEAVKSGDVFRAGPDRVKSLLPLWHWLLFAAGTLLFFDVAVRRVAVDPARVRETSERVWARLRGRSLAPPPAEFFERLRSRKAAVDEGLARPAVAARRFEAAEPAGPAPAAADAASAPAPPPPRPTPPPPAPPQAEAPAEDAMARLMKAKKKAMEDRKKEGQ